jgi:hypothetical protein
MTEEQLESTQKDMIRWSAGLLGTKESPTATAKFLDAYIQVQKESVASCDDELSWRREKSILDGLLGLASAIRHYEDTYKEQIKQEATDG